MRERLEGARGRILRRAWCWGAEAWSTSSMTGCGLNDVRCCTSARRDLLSSPMLALALHVAP